MSAFSRTTEVDESGLQKSKKGKKWTEWILNIVQHNADV